jgi:GNAT superfamily N-acetyltransferase
LRSVEVKRVWNSAGLINNCKQAKGESMAAFFLKKKKEVTETVEEPQKTVEAAKKEAESRSVGRIVLEVRCSNDSAIRLYERNGFVNYGVRKGFYELPKEDAYIMIYGQ